MPPRVVQKAHGDVWRSYTFAVFEISEIKV
jgi:hypothetical protein